MAAAAPAAKTERADPRIELRIAGEKGETSFSLPIQILFLLTFLTLLPSLLISVTSFTRILIVSHFLRQALGTQTMPSNQILIGLALFLTFFVMAPVGEKVHTQALQPLLEGKIDQMEALTRAVVPLRTFMLKYTREKDLALFTNIAKISRPKTPGDLPITVVIPAFMISELKTSFQIGFVLFLPFLVIDMVVSSVLLAMGMMQLPPIVISTPFKILLFIMVDGWNLVIGSVVKSFF
ncbi:MAG: flagellar type III secretion system pore protein FliP [Acidobacteria bacterium]|nr:flagellar type III secretion system pore protein FliP [Acidobacteriota bacterium]